MSTPVILHVVLVAKNRVVRTVRISRDGCPQKPITVVGVGRGARQKSPRDRDGSWESLCDGITSVWGARIFADAKLRYSLGRTALMGNKQVRAAFPLHGAESPMALTNVETLQSVLNDAENVPWATLPGAYGASDATDHYRNIPQMLRVLATVDDTDSGAWGDAYDDCFLAHVWHQFTIYPVTPVATGFLIRIGSLRSIAAVKQATQIVLGLRLVAETAATFRNSPDLVKRELGERTVAAFIAHRDYVITWLSRPFEEHARVISSCIPEMTIQATVQPRPT